MLNFYLGMRDRGWGRLEPRDLIDLPLAMALHETNR